MVLHIFHIYLCVWLHWSIPQATCCGQKKKIVFFIFVLCCLILFCKITLNKTSLWLTLYIPPCIFLRTISCKNNCFVQKKKFFLRPLINIKKIVIKYTYFNHFISKNAVALSTFTTLCSYHHWLFPELFHHLKQKFSTHKATPHSSSPRPC